MNLPKKRKRKWQLKRETKRIGALDLVRSLAVLDFAICNLTSESKADLQWRRYGWEEVAIQTFNAFVMCQNQLELMENGDDEAMNFAWAEEQLRE